MKKYVNNIRRSNFCKDDRDKTELPPNALLVTLDVSSRYTNIPNNESITACRHFLDRRDGNSSTVGTETLCAYALFLL